MESSMSGADWYLLAWKRALDIRGRSRRKEYAYFFVVTALGGLALLGIGSLFGSDEAETITPTRVLLGLYFAGIIVPKTTLIVRRLHDVEMSGWLSLLSLVPYAGLVVDVFCLIADTNPRPNKWGVSPKFASAQRWMTSLHGKSV
jgi:uncharacterized membrane protein YhaH (DUF805 family)